MTAAVAPVLSMPQNAVAARFGEVLRVAFGRERHAVKRLAQTAGASNRTAENWLRGENAPDALYLLRLMATVPEFAGEVRRLTAMEAMHDPEFHRDFQRAMQTFARTQEARDASAALDRQDTIRAADGAGPSRAGGLAHREGAALDRAPHGMDTAS